MPPPTYTRAAPSSCKHFTTDELCFGYVAESSPVHRNFDVISRYEHSNSIYRRWGGRAAGEPGARRAARAHSGRRFRLVLDLEHSRGTHLVDQRDGTSYLDMFGFFASSALGGMNHPELADDDAFRRELAAAAINKPSNSDIYTVPMARFVETFARVLGDPALPHLFFIDGGALAVENALKVAFDWKSRLNESRGLDPALGTKVLHLTEAFHGRSGYTMSLTNTEPGKVASTPSSTGRASTPRTSRTGETSSRPSVTHWTRRGARSPRTPRMWRVSSPSRSRERGGRPPLPPGILPGDGGALP